MVTTVTLNPCLDKTVTIHSFTYGGMNRVLARETQGAGKGINVAIALRSLGGQVKCTGINYREKGYLIHEVLDKKRIEHDFILVEGEVRTNYKIYDRSKQVVTEVNEEGYCIESRDLKLLKNKIIDHCSDSQTIVLSGSVPRGVPNTIYREILKSLSNLSIKTILDTHGDLLLEGLKEAPYIIKPNLYELEKTLGMRATSHSDLIKGARQFIKRGAKIVSVSLGGEGAVIVDKERAYYAKALDVDVKGTVGAGDSMIAGFCIAIQKQLDLGDLLRYGMASATASILREGTLLGTREDFDWILPKIKVKTIG